MGNQRSQKQLKKNKQPVGQKENLPRQSQMKNMFLAIGLSATNRLNKMTKNL